MAQTYPRKTLSVFGAGGTTDDFEQFGSTAVGATNYTKDIATIQTLAAWTNGWRPALVTAKAPIIQDQNAVQYVHSYMQGSVFEEGIPEWDAGTNYSFGSVVKLPYTGGNNFQIFVSLADGNTNNALPTAPASNGSWQFVYGFVGGIFKMGTSLGFGNTATLGIIGTIAADSAGAGLVGEFVRAATTNVNAAASGNWDDGLSISLTPGDWDVSACMNSETNGATWSLCEMGIGAVSGNSGTGLIDGDNLTYSTFTNSATVPLSVGLTIANYRVSISSTTTYYLKRRYIYTAGTPRVAGMRLSARRER